MLRKKYLLTSIAIFGSVARGENSSESDVDLLVDFEKPIGLAIVDLKDELEELLCARVDIIPINAMRRRPRLYELIKSDLIHV